MPQSINIRPTWGVPPGIFAAGWVFILAGVILMEFGKPVGWDYVAIGALVAATSVIPIPLILSQR